MSLCCLSCAAKGKKENCPRCASVAPLPLSIKVKEVIRRAAIEHRIQQEADYQIFKADISGQKDKHEAQLERQRKYRRKQKEAHEPENAQ